MFVYLNCQRCYLPQSACGGENKKIAFVKGGGRKRPPRCVASPDNPKTEAFLLSQNMLHNSKDLSFDKSMDIIQTMSEINAAFSKAEEVANLSGNAEISREIAENSHDTQLWLGLALHQELSKLYEL